MFYNNSRFLFILEAVFDVTRWEILPRDHMFYYFWSAYDRYQMFGGNIPLGLDFRDKN